jgi:hypothetical protein
LRILAGLFFMSFVAGRSELGYLWEERSRPCGSIPRIRLHPTTATTSFLLRAVTAGLHHHDRSSNLVIEPAGRSIDGYR